MTQSMTHESQTTIRTAQPPFPKDAKGKTFFDQTPSYLRVERSCIRWTMGTVSVGSAFWGESTTKKLFRRG